MIISPPLREFFLVVGDVKVDRRMQICGDEVAGGGERKVLELGDFRDEWRFLMPGWIQVQPQSRGAVDGMKEQKEVASGIVGYVPSSLVGKKRAWVRKYLPRYMYLVTNSRSRGTAQSYRRDFFGVTICANS